jgi:hypothetical protein
MRPPADRPHDDEELGMSDIVLSGLHHVTAIASDPQQNDPQSIFARGPQVIAYRAVLDVPRELVAMLARQLRAGRRAPGTRAGGGGGRGSFDGQRNGGPRYLRGEGGAPGTTWITDVPLGAVAHAMAGARE